MADSNYGRKRQSNITFATSTKPRDGPGLEVNRQSVVDGDAWSGMLSGKDLSDDSDSDSDDGVAASSRSNIPAPRNAPHSSGGSAGAGRGDVNDGANNARASWTTRAAAVGSRPPDTASQNPPSLKMLGLKSLKDGGTPFGSSEPRSPALEMRQQVEQRQRQEQLLQQRQQQQQQQQQRPQQQVQPPVPQQQPFDGQDAARSANQQRQPLPQSARDYPPAGTSAPQPAMRSTSRQPSHERENERPRYQQHESYIAFGGSDGFGGMSSIDQPDVPQTRGYELRDEVTAPERIAAAPSARPQQQSQQTQLDPRTALTRQLGLESRSASPALSERSRNMPQQPEPSHYDASGGRSYNRARSPFDDREAAAGPNGAPSNPIPRTLVAGGGGHSPWPYEGRRPQQEPTNGSSARPNNIDLQRGPAPAPASIALPSPVHMPRPFDEQAPTGSMHPPPHARHPPTSFSNTAGPQRTPSRRQSMFRRSMAMFKGGDQQGGPRPRQGNNANGGGGGAQRQSLFRRSVMWLSGREQAPPQPQPLQQRQAPVADDDDSNAPQPRVQGFIDEKPRGRKSTYLGGGGMGDEWDVNGNGARFWKRFSTAQHLHENGVFRETDAVRRKVEKRRKMTLYGSLVGGILIVAAVIAIIIWRENVQSSAVPGALDRATFGPTTESAAPTGASSGRNNLAVNNAAQESPAAKETKADRAARATAAATPAAEKHRKHRENEDKEEKGGDGDDNRRRRRHVEASDFRVRAGDTSAATVRRGVEAAFQDDSAVVVAAAAARGGPYHARMTTRRRSSLLRRM